MNIEPNKVNWTWGWISWWDRRSHRPGISTSSIWLITYQTR